MITENNKEPRPPEPPAAQPPPARPQPAKGRVFLVDDHAMFREGLRHLIDREPDLMVCGDAAAATEAMQGISETKPDLVIVDISLAGASGIDLIKAVKSQYEDMPVLVVSMHDESLYAERALRAGAMGYVMKQEPAKTVKAAIRKVLAGDMHLSEKLASSLVSRFMHGAAEHTGHTNRDAERPRVGGLPHARPGERHAADCGGDGRNGRHHQLFQEPYQGEAGPEDLDRGHAARHPVGAGGDEPVGRRRWSAWVDDAACASRPVGPAAPAT